MNVPKHFDIFRGVARLNFITFITGFVNSVNIIVVLFDVIVVISTKCFDFTSNTQKIPLKQESKHTAVGKNSNSTITNDTFVDNNKRIRSKKKKIIFHNFRIDINIFHHLNAHKFENNTEKIWKQ